MTFAEGPFCGTDLHEYQEGPIFIPQTGHPHPLSRETEPVTIGHEFSGTVTALGEGVTDLTVGEHAVGHHAYVRSGAKAGEVAFIAGAGPIGLLLAAVLKAEGLTVVISELSEARKAKARSTGVADHVLDPGAEDVVARVRELTGGPGADVCFECSSSNPAWSSRASTR